MYCRATGKQISHDWEVLKPFCLCHKSTDARGPVRADNNNSRARIKTAFTAGFGVTD
jgi:hypothetical protein